MSRTTSPTGRSGTPGRYKRSTGGLVTALVVTVVVVGAYVGLRSLVTPEPPPIDRSVDWQAQVRAGEADGKLTIAAPASLPDGWRANVARYDTGLAPAWQLGLLTDEERFVGVYERLASIDTLVAEHVDEDARQGDDVEIAGETWQVWTDRGGDYAVARELDQPVGEPGALLVVGTAGEDVVQEFAGSLR